MDQLLLRSHEQESVLDACADLIIREGRTLLTTTLSSELEVSQLLVKKLPETITSKVIPLFQEDPDKPVYTYFCYDSNRVEVTESKGLSASARERERLWKTEGYILVDSTIARRLYTRNK